MPPGFFNWFGWGAPAPLPSPLPAADPESQAIHDWFSQNQKSNPVGLVTSYPEEIGFFDQAFTYDQALSGILFLKHGNKDAARKIFDFLRSKWDGQGCWTVYNSKVEDGSTLEYMKVMGPTAWVGIFAMHYFSATQDPKAVELALKIARWIKELPHKNGGVAMGSEDFWKNIYSVENNLDYYALLQALLPKVQDAGEKQFFSDEFGELREWFENKSYDNELGLFKRGEIDKTQSLDTNAWSLLVFGVPEIEKLFGINTHDFISRTENAFKVQDSGNFSGDVLTAKGFDFSNAQNAASSGRKGIKWVEGTNQMVVAYHSLKEHFSKPEVNDAAKASHYENRIAHFCQKNADNRFSDGALAAYHYTDKPGAKIWWDNPYWMASKGSAAASSAWVYFSLNKVNPFAISV